MAGFLRNRFGDFFRVIFALAALASALAAQAEDNAETVVRTLIERVSTDLGKLHKENRIGDRAALEQLIRDDIMPSVDQQHLTRRVFRQYWAQLEKASRQDEARERVVNALVRTYAAALSGYDGDTISLISVSEQGKKTTAKSRIRRPNGQTIQVDFSLGNNSGRWLINDMAVDGIVVSLTLFNAMKSVWDTQGMEAALASIASVDVNQQKNQQKQ